MKLNDRSDALRLLSELGATPRLLHHAQTVSDTAVLLVTSLQSMDVNCDARSVEVGAVLHDAGKIQHPDELSEPGRMHEQAGETLLLSKGIQPELARFCISHSEWSQPNTSLEERLVALADKLWKGKREADLELLVIDEIARKLGTSRWDVFDVLDTAFEDIAASGAERLERSRQY